MIVAGCRMPLGLELPQGDVSPANIDNLWP
jgi:hypothetical protein